MYEKRIGTRLRQLRKANGLSVSDVIDLLWERFGRRLSKQALYSYEGNTRALHADLFLMLCQLYGCSHILEVFSDISLSDDLPTEEEWDFIRILRELQPAEQQTVAEIMHLYQKNSRKDQPQLYAADAFLPGSDAGYHISTDDTSPHAAD